MATPSNSRRPPPSKRTSTLQNPSTSTTNQPSTSSASASNSNNATPYRIEPKAHFAIERNFLSWASFSVILGGLAVGLLNFGDEAGRITAVLFTLLSISILIYALVRFYYRASSVRKRNIDAFEDKVGPKVLCVAVCAAIIANFVLRLLYD